MTLTDAREQLKTLQAKLKAYYHASTMIFYDGQTTAPKGTAANRARTLSVLSEEEYKLSTGKETVELLEFLDANKDELNEEERREVFLLLKSIRQMQKVPMNEYVEYEELLVEADDVWHRAKEASDFSMFEPVLEKIFETNKRFAGYFAPGKDPYDYWLGEYEDGLTKAVCDDFFAKVRACLVPLLKKVSATKQVDDSFLWGVFPIEKQRELSDYLMRTMGLDLTHVGIAETEHAFTTNLGSHLDERITTHYHEDYFVSSMYSVIHEGGHALYDTGCRDEYAFTAIDGGVSMGIHESQSRFYENIIGRSRAYCEFIFPKLVELFPELKAHTAEDFYRAVNKAEPSLIRTEADEVTYCLHVMVRYELEKRVMAGDLKVHDLPAAWNALYKEYLGVDVPDDKHGVLQDSHWSGGSIGYFPSYALGSAYGAQFLDKMKKSIDVDACIREGNFAPINTWNKAEIWQYGSLYKPCEILDKVLGAPFDPDFYLRYLEAKVKDVYGV